MKILRDGTLNLRNSGRCLQRKSSKNQGNIDSLTIESRETGTLFLWSYAPGASFFFKIMGKQKEAKKNPLASAHYYSKFSAKLSLPKYHSAKYDLLKEQSPFGFIQIFLNDHL